MKENKITTYLLYAIGEIILVVLGILIAVNINNWSRNKADEELQHKYILEIKGALEEDMTIYERLTRRLYLKNSTIQVLMDGIESQELVANLDSIFWYSGWQIKASVKQHYRDDL